MQNFVVVYDPEGTLAEGKIFISDERYFAAVRRGVVMIPVAEGGRNALSPWSVTHFGDKLFANSSVPTYLGRAALYLERKRGSVGWAALLRFPVGTKPEGLLRLVGDPNQPPLLSAPVVDEPSNRVALDVPTHPNHRGESHLVIQGKTSCQTGAEGVYAFALHGVARECSLAWLAVSQAV